MPNSGDYRTIRASGSITNSNIVSGDNSPVGVNHSLNLANRHKWRTGNILFAYVKGSSALSDTERQTFLTSILPLIRTRVGGMAWRNSKTWGDGIVLVSDGIAELCETALHIRNVFIDTYWAKYRLPPLATRIALHHGEYFEFKNSITNRRDFSGKAIDEAARLEPVTPAGKIWMTEQAAALLKSHMKSDASNYFAYDDLGEVDLPENYGRVHVAELRRGHEPPAARSG